MKHIIASAVGMMLLLSACQKKDETVADASNVVTTITSPQSGQQFRSGDTVFIRANISYPSELHGYELKITDTATGAVLYDDDQHVHSDKIVIEDQWISAATKPLGLKLSIVTEIDHDGHEAEKEVTFGVIP